MLCVLVCFPGRKSAESLLRRCRSTASAARGARRGDGDGEATARVVWTASNRREAAALQVLGVFRLSNFAGSSERISDVLQMTLRNA